MVNLFPFLSYMFIVTFTPGPNNIMSMSNGNRFGYKKTLKFLLGIFTGFVVVMLICSYFNLLLFNVMPKVKIVMGIVGAVYMIYLAIKIMKSEEPDENDGSESLNSFVTGMTMQFVNPKVLIYAITVIANFIIPYYQSKLELLAFSVFLASMAFISVSCWAFFGALFNKFLSQYRKPFNITLGILLIYSALSISGITNLF